MDIARYPFSLLLNIRSYPDIYLLTLPVVVADKLDPGEGGVVQDGDGRHQQDRQ